MIVVLALILNCIVSIGKRILNASSITTNNQN